MSTWGAGSEVAVEGACRRHGGLEGGSSLPPGCAAPLPYFTPRDVEVWWRRGDEIGTAPRRWWQGIRGGGADEEWQASTCKPREELEAVRSLNVRGGERRKCNGQG